MPVPNLRPPLAICKPTGVTLGAGDRVVLMFDKNGAGDALTVQLKSLGVEVLSIDGTQNSEDLANMLKAWLAAGPIQGVYWLPALDNEGPLSRMDLAAWHQALQVRVKSFYTAMRTLYEQIAQPGTFLVAATWLGGQHGYDETGAVAPMGGAVTGFIKTYKRERPDALVKAVDFEEGRNATEIAGLLIEETLRDNGAVEIGYQNGLRWTIALEEQLASDGQPGFALDSKSVFVITGAAGSIVSAITVDLAAASGGTFYLLDLVPEPDANNPDIARFVNDKDRPQARSVCSHSGARRASHSCAGGKRVGGAGACARGPQCNQCGESGRWNTSLLQRQPRGRRRRRESNCRSEEEQRPHRRSAARRRSGAQPLLAGQRPAGIRSRVRREVGRLVQFAACDRRHATGRDGCVQFGRRTLRQRGQADYSAANDLLCKYTSSFRSTRPQTRGIVIDWTAWGGIGMATRGSIPKMMELAGIDMLPPEAGIPLIRRELTTGGTRGEIVIGTRLGVLLDEWDAAGGLDTAALLKSREQLGQGPMVGTITGVGVYSGLTMETTLDPKVQPFLYDHQIDGIPVLPGVMGIEAFAEAALCMHPGWHIEAIEEVNFLAPFKFYKDEPRAVIIQATLHPQGDKLVADCRLIGRRVLPNHPQPQETLHFTARVRVSKQPTPAVKGATPQLTAEAIVAAAQIYRLYFHGPAYQVVDHAWWDGQQMIGELADSLPVNHQPADRPTLMSPRLIELCFQTAGLWEIGAQKRMGLPLHVGQVSWLRAPKSAEGHLYALVTPHPEQGSFDAEVVDSSGNRYLILNGYRTVATGNGLDAESLKAMQAVIAAEPAVVS